MPKEGEDILLTLKEVLVLKILIIYRNIEKRI